MTAVSQRPAQAASQSPAQPASLARLLTPGNVVIVGAKDSSSTSYGVVEGLNRVGFTGRIFAVNRSATPAHGLATVSRCTAIGEPVDAAVLLVPAAAVGEVLDDVAAAGITTAVVLSGGWAEVDAAGAARQAKLARRACELGVTIVGPNCLGFINFAARTGAWVASVPLGVRPGTVAIVSQSGGVGNALVDLAAEFDVGLSHAVTTGNEAMLTTTEVLEYLVEDEQTSTIALFAETIAQPARFMAAANRARELGKAIVILKAGSSAIAARNAISHTGSMVGDDRIVDAALRQHGAVRVRSLEELVITAGVIARAGPLRTPGIAVVSASGGSAGIVADQADRLGLELPPLDDSVAAGIRAVLPAFSTVQNPLDMTGGALGDEFEKVIAIMSRQNTFGAIAVLSNVPGYESCKVAIINRLLATIGRGLRSAQLPGFVLSQSIAHLNETGREAVRSAGITGLPGLALGIPALAHLAWWSRWRSQQAARSAPAPLPGPGLPGLRLPVHDGALSEWAARELLVAAGVPFVPAVLASSPADAARQAARFGSPVAAKLCSPDVPHKSDVGAVRLGVDAAAAGRAFEEVVAAGRSAGAAVRIEGVQISPMRRGGVELLVGVTRDADWGLALAVGMGGVLTEVLADVAVRLLPVTDEDISQMLAELRGSAVLDGPRGEPAVDRAALVRAISQIAEAAGRIGDRLESLEVNPLRADQSGAEALDVLLQLRDASATVDGMEVPGR
jgi:acetate---CoA ligase (ADP-forming)